MKKPRMLAIPEDVFYNRNLSRMDLEVWIEIFQFKNSSFYASDNWIANKTEHHIKKIKSSIKKLCNLGFLKVTIANGRRYLETTEPSPKYEAGNLPFTTESAPLEVGNQTVPTEPNGSQEGTKRFQNGEPNGSSLIVLSNSNLSSIKDARAGRADFEGTFALLNFTGFDNPELAKTALGNWLEHKRSIRSQFKTVEGIQELLDKWAIQGAEYFLNAVKFSKESGYKGLFASPSQTLGQKPSAYEQAKTALKITPEDFK